jgi:hypothetical protein
LSRHRTSCGWAKGRSQRFDPSTPAPPVEDAFRFDVFEVHGLLRQESGVLVTF